MNNLIKNPWIEQHPKIVSLMMDGLMLYMRRHPNFLLGQFVIAQIPSEQNYYDGYSKRFVELMQKVEIKFRTEKDLPAIFEFIRKDLDQNAQDCFLKMGIKWE